MGWSPPLSGSLSATENHSIAFRQFHEAASSRIRYQKMRELDGQVVHQGEIGRVYEISRDTIIEVTDAERDMSGSCPRHGLQFRAPACMDGESHARGDRQRRKRQPVPLRADRGRAAAGRRTADPGPVHDR
ncbi:Ku protein [Streptomyces agglomeratus]|uniref:Ku protein n=1 Tax=Streptomyces agglomeratus TaxID=285458 RepID=UPI0034E53EFB